MLICADMHTHTVASTHAYSTLRENVEVAARKHLQAIAMTEHAPSDYDSPHIWAFHNLKKAVPREIYGVKIFYGVEANIINYDGEIDFPKSECQDLDWVIASFHGMDFPAGGVDDRTKMYLGVAENPDVDAIGHPAYAGKEFDYEKCMKKFKEYNKFVEINESCLLRGGNKANNIEIINICKKYEIPVVVNSDAHFCENIGNVCKSAELIEELGLPRNLVINADFDRLCEHIFTKKKKIIF